MPPKPKFTKEEIVQTALEVVSQKGAEALTAQELANALGSSARPIFTVFRTMQEVQDAVREAAMRRFETFAAQKLPDMPLFKQIDICRKRQSIFAHKARAKADFKYFIYYVYPQFSTFTFQFSTVFF